MAHIAFFAAPYTGHITPTLPVVAELVARGHRVSYAAPRPYLDMVRTTGARPVGYQSTLVRLADSAEYTSAVLVRLLRMLLTETVATLPGLARAFAADRPDVVVYDAPTCWSGRLLALRWGIPVVRSHPSLVANRHWSLAGYTRFTAHPDLSALIAGVARLLARTGSGLTADEFFADDDGTPAIVYLPRAFQYAGDTFAEHVHFVGPCLGPSPYPRWRSPEDGRPVAMVSLGTIHNARPQFFQSCVRALAPAGWRTVIALGNAAVPDGLGDEPHVEVHAFVAQRDVLRTARVFVNHGGMGSLMESLACGVPVVAVPQMAEHRANADRLVELGVGRQVAAESATAAVLREAVMSVIDDHGVRQRIAALRAQIDAAGGAPAAANVIEARLHEPPTG
jgi:MGT family glycosyltransferase